MSKIHFVFARCLACRIEKYTFLWRIAMLGLVGVTALTLSLRRVRT